MLVSHLGAVGCCSQLFLVRSLQLVITSISATASAATMARVFMAQSVRVAAAYWLQFANTGRILLRSFHAKHHRVGLAVCSLLFPVSIYAQSCACNCLPAKSNSETCVTSGVVQKSLRSA